MTDTRVTRDFLLVTGEAAPETRVTRDFLLVTGEAAPETRITRDFLLLPAEAAPETRVTRDFLLVIADAATFLVFAECEGFGSSGLGGSGFGTEDVFAGTVLTAIALSLSVVEVTTDIDDPDALLPSSWAVASGPDVIAVLSVVMVAPLLYRLTLVSPATPFSLGAVNLACDSTIEFDWPGAGPRLENVGSCSAFAHVPNYERILRQRFVCFDAVDDDGFLDIVVIAVFATGRQEAVYSLAGGGFTPAYLGSGVNISEGGMRREFAVRPKTGWIDAEFVLRVTMTDSSGNVDTGVVL